METTVEVKNYKAFLQELVRRFSHGYHYYSLTIYPEKKREKWQSIDQKILSKYPLLTLSKYQRTRRKRAGKLNAMMIRYDRYMLLQATSGKDDIGLKTKETLENIRKKSLILNNLYGTLCFRVGKKEKGYTVYFEKAYWRDLKAYWSEKASKATPEAVREEWQKMDQACPSWAGVASQKVRLRKLILEKCKKRGIKGLNLEISPLKPVKVWKGEG